MDKGVPNRVGTYTGQVPEVIAMEENIKMLSCSSISHCFF